MIRRAFNWIGLVLPRWWPLFFVVYLLSECPYFILYLSGTPLDSSVLRTRDFILSLIASLYAIFRVRSFHPLWQPEYRRWLELTPWAIKKPLPKGPLHLVPQDFLALGVLVGLQHDSMLGRQLVPLAFGITYMTALCLSIAFVLPNAAYALAFGLSLPVLFIRQPLVAVGACVLLYLLTFLASREMSARFPWRFPEMSGWFVDRIAVGKSPPAEPLGWPADYFRARPAQWRVSVYDGCVLSFLAGWWMLVLGWTWNDVRDLPQPPLEFFIYLYGLPICVVIRCVPYFRNYRPPISVLGRIATGRWIIPGFDVAFIAPLSAFILGVAVPAFAQWRGYSLVVPIAGATTGVLLILLNLGPTLETWQLTGAHRIVPTSDKVRLLKH